MRYPHTHARWSYIVFNTKWKKKLRIADLKNNYFDECLNLIYLSRQLLSRNYLRGALKYVLSSLLPLRLLLMPMKKFISYIFEFLIIFVSYIYLFIYYIMMLCFAKVEDAICTHWRNIFGQLRNDVGNNAHFQMGFCLRLNSFLKCIASEVCFHWKCFFFKLIFHPLN